MSRQGAIVCLLMCFILSAPAHSQSRITTPKEQFGFNFGDDYQLASYQQISEYWHKLDRESDRMIVQEIGKTAEGRPHLMAIVTSPENHKNLAKYRDISARLARAEGLSDDQARALAKEGKAVVWIDGGLHATEVLGAQQLGEMVYQMVSRTDEETMRFLNDCIILLVHANPDGNDLTAEWYMRESDPLKRTLNGLPKLYQKYIGHDNNRDFFMSTQAETESINRILYHEWLPQLLYNHHQSGPAGTVVYSPPLRDPFNYNQELGVGFDAVSATPAADALKLKKPRVGLWDQYGGSIDAGWARWILEQFEFSFDRVFAPQLDAGNLNSKYDVLVFVGGAIPNRGGAPPLIANVPAEYAGQQGRVTVEKTLPELKKFMETGGTLIAIEDSAMNLAKYLRLPVDNHLVENGQPLRRTKFYTPGSLLNVRIDTSNPLAAGMSEQTNVFFDNNPVFKLNPGAESEGVRAFGTFDAKTPLRSGWSWGREYLMGGAVGVEANVGKGRAVLLTPNVLQRAQPHATFKLLFNGIYYAAAGK